MRKFLSFVVALVMAIPVMAIGRNDGSTKANAIDFDWEAPMTHDGGTKWYVVYLDPLYEEETPALNLFLANKDPLHETQTTLKATVAGQTEEKSFVIGPKQQKVWSANATMLVRLKQKEIYLTLNSTGPVLMSARVFEAQDLDETCKDAFAFNWTTGITKPAGVPIWYKVDIKNAKANTTQDVCVIVANNGTQKLTLIAGQSLDCPSSGVTKRTIELAAGDTLRDTVPNSMLNGVAFDELYVSLENDQPISVKAEYANRPDLPVMPGDTSGTYYTLKTVPDTSLHTTDVMTLSAGETYYFKYNVAQLNSLAKYEPEFTFRNTGTTQATIERKMAFDVAAYVAQGNTLVLDANEESVEVITKNTLIGLDNQFVYVKITSDADVQLISRFKHVREGKACRTNIDFNWDPEGLTQSANTKLWYAVAVADVRDNLEDIIVHVQNLSDKKASVNASLAFSCPYIDLQEVHHTIAAGAEEKRTIAYSTYGMMTDTVWIGIETNQNIKFWATTKPAETHEPDEACLTATKFNWENGVVQHAGDTVWYKISMDEVREQSAKFPTVFVQNLNSSAPAKITAELSLECPDEVANQKRSKTLAAGASYSKQLSRNLFENIVQDTIFLRVITTQDIALQVRLNEEEEGASCSSAIPFNWVAGNSQSANQNLWYVVDLRDVMKGGNDIRLHIENKDNVTCKGVAQLLYECPTTSVPSVQNFSLKAHAEKAITVQNSAFETLSDSVAYVNVQGTTALRVWAEIFPKEDFDTIYADGLTLIPLQWDTIYTQTVDTAWYIVPKSEIDKLVDLEDKVKPVAHLWNIGTEATTYKVEGAFAFPIVKKMMTKSKKLGAGKHYSDTVPYGTFEQILKKDSIILRVTRPKGGSDFQFRAELVNAFTGNTRADALPIRLGERYEQEPNTEMWYKISTADWKKDSTLFTKRLKTFTKNIGTGTAEVTISVYDGLLSNVDILEDYGLGDYRKRKIKKGEKKTRTFPAQYVYALNDVEMYISIRTTDAIAFGTKFYGEYAPQAVDPKQAEATLLAPNVEYVIPGDTLDHWYMLCVPYMYHNYIYTDSAKLKYSVNGTAHVEMTHTFQDTMNCQMPVRKRTLNKKGGYMEETKPLSKLIQKGIDKAGIPFDIEGTEASFVDSLLHLYLTKDSITAYFRVKTDNELKFTILMEQITGDQCDHPMHFDWEHGNVNPAGGNPWYLVKLDSLIIPDSCDLRLHVDNWSAEENNVTADLYFDCNDPKTTGKTYAVEGNGQDTLDIDRDFLRTLGWADLVINYSSDKPSHIWAELIKDMARDTIPDTIRAFVCYGGSYEDTIRNNQKTIENIVKDTTWKDFVSFQDGVVMKDSMITFIIRPIIDPELITVDAMKNLNAAPLLVQGMQLYVKASNDSLDAYYKALGAAQDTIIDIDTVYWAKPVYKPNGDLDETTEAELDLNAFYPKTQEYDTLLLVIKGECERVIRQDYIFPIEPYKYISRDDTICSTPTVNPDTIEWQVLVPDTLGLDRQVDTIVTYYTRTLPPTIFTEDQLMAKPIVANGAAIDTTYTVRALKQQFEDDPDADELTMKVTDIQWQVLVGTEWLNMPYTVGAEETLVTMHYVITTECGDVINSQNIDYTLTPGPPPPPACENDTVWMETPEQACVTYHWDKDNQDYTVSGTYYYDATDEPVGTDCHKVYELNLVVNSTYAMPKDSVTSCNKYDWRGVTYTETGIYYDSLTTKAGCDSVYVLDLTIKGASYVDSLDIKAYYGYRIVMINRNQINKLPGWSLDSLDVEHPEYVTWHEIDLSGNDKVVGDGGYYYNLPNGEPLPTGYQYYAVIDVPASVNAECGVQGKTKTITVAATAAAPAVVPSLAKPGETVRVINLDPEVQTSIRLYTAEGLLQKTYTSYGQTSFPIQAGDLGFYLVELSADNMKSTLRYIVQ